MRGNCVSAAALRLELALAAVLLLAVVPLLAACGGATGATVPLPTATHGAITLTTDASAYTTSQPVGVTVVNAGSQSDYALDSLTGCTFLQLQQYNPTRKQWTSIKSCADGSNPQPVLITAGISEPFTLAPGGQSNSNAWNAGEYRVALAYSAAANGTTSVVWAYSRGFTIH